jgi:hypothetical protein
MGFVNILPPVKLVTGNIATTADSWAAGQTMTNVPGAIAFHKTDANKWSLLKYYQANASISKGFGLVRPAAATAGYVLAHAATTDVNSYALKGIAAADVSNTGYFSFAYIGGYCPDIKFNSGAASGQIFGLSGSIAGWFGSTASAGSTIAVGTKPYFFPVTSFEATDSSAGTLASGWISPVLM